MNALNNSSKYMPDEIKIQVKNFIETPHMLTQVVTYLMWGRNHISQSVVKLFSNQ